MSNDYPNPQIDDQFNFPPKQDEDSGDFQGRPFDDHDDLPQPRGKNIDNYSNPVNEADEDFPSRLNEDIDKFEVRLESRKEWLDKHLHLAKNPQEFLRRAIDENMFVLQDQFDLMAIYDDYDVLKKTAGDLRDRIKQGKDELQRLEYIIQQSIEQQQKREQFVPSKLLNEITEKFSVLRKKLLLSDNQEQAATVVVEDWKRILGEIQDILAKLEGEYPDFLPDVQIVLYGELDQWRQRIRQAETLQQILKVVPDFEESPDQVEAWMYTLWLLRKMATEEVLTLYKTDIDSRIRAAAGALKEQNTELSLSNYVNEDHSLTGTPPPLFHLKPPTQHGPLERPRTLLTLIAMIGIALAVLAILIASGVIGRNDNNSGESIATPTAIDVTEIVAAMLTESSETIAAIALTNPTETATSTLSPKTPTQTTTPSAICTSTPTSETLSGDLSPTYTATTLSPTETHTPSPVSIASPVPTNTAMPTPQPPEIAHTFSETNISAGETAVLTITITNPNEAVQDINLTEMVKFADGGTPAEGDVEIVSVTGDCFQDDSHTYENNLLMIGSITLSGNDSCAVEVMVKINRINKVVFFSPVSDSDSGEDNTFGATTLSVATPPPPTFTKEFDTTTVAKNHPIHVTFTIANNSAIELTGGMFTDTLTTRNDGSISYSVDYDASTCGNMAKINLAPNDPSTLQLTDLTLGVVDSGNNTCTVVATINTANSGVFTSETTTFRTREGVSASLSDGSQTEFVVANPPIFAKEFVTEQVNIGEQGTLKFTIKGSDTISLTGISFSDEIDAIMRSGIVYADIDAEASTCDSQPFNNENTSILVEPNLLTVSGLSLPTTQECVLIVLLDTTEIGRFNTTTSQLTMEQLGAIPAPTAMHPFVVVIPPPTMIKAITPEIIFVGQRFILEWTLINNANVELTGLEFTENLNAYSESIKFDPDTLVGTCAPMELELPELGAQEELTIRGISLAAHASCTVSVEVEPFVPGIFELASTDMQMDGTPLDLPLESSEISLNVHPQPFFKAAFEPAEIQVGQNTTLTITLTNNAPIELPNINLVYTMATEPADALQHMGFATGTCNEMEYGGELRTDLTPELLVNSITLGAKADGEITSSCILQVSFSASQPLDSFESMVRLYQVQEDGSQESSEVDIPVQSFLGSLVVLESPVTPVEVRVNFTDGARVRVEPSLTSEIFITVPAGSPVQVTGQGQGQAYLNSETWYCITYLVAANGPVTGWAHSATLVQEDITDAVTQLPIVETCTAAAEGDSE